MSTPPASMTGFARAAGQEAGSAWSWELRSVNARGLDLRFRLPSGYDGLEPALREAAGRSLRRGSINATLTVKSEAEHRLVVDPAALDEALDVALALAARIPDASPPRAEALLALPGVLRPVAAEDRGGAPNLALPPVLLQGFTAALDALVTMRRGEGARLAARLTGLLGEIAVLREQAAHEAAGQPAAQRARMMESLQTILRDAPQLPEERVAQEVALLATRSDVREELDRLASHLEAAHALLAEGEQIGRRLDFLVQEFVREANTLCSKSVSAALTTTGLRLKAAIEQLREQVQNIE